MCARSGVCVNVVGNTKRAYGMECPTAYIVPGDNTSVLVEGLVFIMEWSQDHWLVAC